VTCPLKSNRNGRLSGVALTQEQRGITQGIISKCSQALDGCSTISVNFLPEARFAFIRNTQPLVEVMLTGSKVEEGIYDWTLGQQAASRLQTDDGTILTLLVEAAQTATYPPNNRPNIWVDTDWTSRGWQSINIVKTWVGMVRDLRVQLSAQSLIGELFNAHAVAGCTIAVSITITTDYQFFQMLLPMRIAWR
jgi:hypothetical protein